MHLGETAQHAAREEKATCFLPPTHLPLAEKNALLQAQSTADLMETWDVHAFRRYRHTEIGLWNFHCQREGVGSKCEVTYVPNYSMHVSAPPPLDRLLNMEPDLAASCWFAREADGAATQQGFRLLSIAGRYIHHPVIIPQDGRMTTSEVTGRPVSSPAVYTLFVQRLPCMA
jgi:hypothetical protein